jgi:hypothetical protein
MRRVIFVVLAALASSQAFAQTGPPKERRVLEVGPQRALKTPSAAAAIVRNGDHVKIDAGQYQDCAVWRVDDLVLEGVGGTPHVKDVTCEDQAIWLIRGNRTTVKNVEFSRAHARANNGAGIKLLGSSLTVLDSKFHDNENGILTAPGEKSAIRIVNSEFIGNGKCEPDCAHGIYIGHVERLVVTGSTFKEQRIAHHIKSRAMISEIVGNRIEDGITGTASYLIDLPNGGTAVIRNNYLQKGPESANRMGMIVIAAEGASNPSRGIYIGQNSFLSMRERLDSFVLNHAPNTYAQVVVEGNRWLGEAGNKLKGPGQVRP